MYEDKEVWPVVVFIIGVFALAIAFKNANFLWLLLLVIL